MHLTAALCGLAALLHGASFASSGPCDDDFILYRYAQNLVAGEGLVYNPGEWIEGFSTWLWVLVLVAGMGLGLAPELVSQGLGLASFAALAWVLVVFGQRKSPELGWIPGLAAALSPALAYHASLGLGTVPLALALTLGFVLFQQAEARGASLVPAGLALGIACLLRAEALLFALPFAAWGWRKGRGVGALLPLLFLLGLSITRWRLYGRTLPVTYDVKKLPLLADLGYGLRYLTRGTLESGVGALLLLAPWALRDTRNQAWKALVLGLFLHTLYVVYVGGDYLPLGRFFVPTLPLLYLTGFLGLRELLRARPHVLLPVCALFVLALQWPQLQRFDIRERYAFQEERWKQIGLSLRDRVDEDQRIALSPIGAIGFHSGLHVVDILGLTSDAVWRADPDLTIDLKGHHRYDADWVLSQEPDLCILGNGVLAPGSRTLQLGSWERTLFTHPEFTANYEPFTIPIHESYPLIVYKRRGSPMPRDAQPIQRF